MLGFIDLNWITPCPLQTLIPKLFPDALYHQRVVWPDQSRLFLRNLIRLKWHGMNPEWDCTTVQEHSNHCTPDNQIFLHSQSSFSRMHILASVSRFIHFNLNKINSVLKVYRSIWFQLHACMTIWSPKKIYSSNSFSGKNFYNIVNYALIKTN